MHIQSVVTQSHVGRRREFIFSGKRRGEKVERKKRKIVRMETSSSSSYIVLGGISPRLKLRNSSPFLFFFFFLPVRNPLNEIIPICVQRVTIVGKGSPPVYIRSGLVPSIISFDLNRVSSDGQPAQFKLLPRHFHAEHIPFAHRKWGSSSPYIVPSYSHLLWSFFFPFGKIEWYPPPPLRWPSSHQMRLYELLKK
jgi:hypothetical protein